MIVTLRSLESVHRLSYFLFCNVLHIWTIRAIPTYRVYRLYDNNLSVGKAPPMHPISYFKMSGWPSIMEMYIDFNLIVDG